MKSAYQSLECIFPRWKCSKFETSVFVLDMVLKVSQTKFYRIRPEKKRQTFSFKKNFSTFKNFHFERNVLISRLNFYILKIRLWSKKLYHISVKLKTCSLKRIFQLLKIFILKSAYQSLECIFPRWKCSKFETSDLCWIWS